MTADSPSAREAIELQETRRIEHEAATWASCFEAIKRRLSQEGFTPTDLKEITSTIYIQLRRR